MAVTHTGRAENSPRMEKESVGQGGGAILGKSEHITVMALMAVLMFLGTYGIMAPPGAFSEEADDTAAEDGRAPRIVQVDRQPAGAVQYLVDINQAGVHDLILLPGVGEKTAEKIIAERGLNGEFRSVDDLTRVRGIGAKKVEALRAYVMPISEAEEQMAAAFGPEKKKSGNAEM